MMRIFFFCCFHMLPENSEILLSWIGPKIKKATTKMREQISLGQRLCVTLRYVVAGNAHVHSFLQGWNPPFFEGTLLSGYPPLSEAN